MEEDSEDQDTVPTLIDAPFWSSPAAPAACPQGNHIALYAASADSFPVILITPKSAYQWEAGRLSNLLTEVQNKYRTDTHRVYVTGFSMGAHGSFDWAADEPARIAAAVMIAGAGRGGDGCELIKNWGHSIVSPYVESIRFCSFFSAKVRGT